MRIEYTKHPRIFHLPWSLDFDDDDKVISSLEQFKGKTIVVTEKLDGENTTLYDNYVHARSINSRHHESQSWVKVLQSKIGSSIPDGYRICGENMYAKHSIFYENLDTYFYVHSVWDGKNECLSWDQTLTFVRLFPLLTVPVIYYGLYDENKIKQKYEEFIKDGHESEGYVMRLADKITYDDYTRSVAKFRRKNHVNKNERHWKYGKKMIVNKLKK